MKKINVALIHYVAGISCKQLSEALTYNGVKNKVFRLKDEQFIDEGFTHVFSYGCSYPTATGVRLNNSVAVESCVNKPTTFNKLKAAKCKTVDHVLRKEDIPENWDWVVIRSKVDGRKAEGLEYAENIKGQIPNGVLFSEYYGHKQEYRIMVFRGNVIGRYFKKEDSGDWYFNNQPAKGFEEMDKHCIRAAKALGIDYVGFDVVAKNKKEFAILEANSGPRITDEAENVIVEYFINL